MVPLAGSSKCCCSNKLPNPLPGNNRCSKWVACREAMHPAVPWVAWPPAATRLACKWAACPAPAVRCQGVKCLAVWAHLAVPHRAAKWPAAWANLVVPRPVAWARQLGKCLVAWLPPAAP